MAGRAGISFEEVAGAAEAILAAGGKPTSRSIREKLGTGSFTKVLEHFNAWQATRRSPALEAVELSSDLRRAMVNEIERAVSSARVQTLEELDEVKKERDALAQEAQERTEEADQLQNKVSELESTLAAQSGTIGELRTTMASAAHREKELFEKVDRLTQELARAQVRLDELPKFEAAALDARLLLEAEREKRHAAERQYAGAEATALANANAVAQHIAQSQVDHKDLNELRNRLAETAQALADAEAGRREAIARAEAAGNLIQPLETRLTATEKRAMDAEARATLLTEQLLANQRG